MDLYCPRRSVRFQVRRPIQRNRHSRGAMGRSEERPSSTGYGLWRRSHPTNGAGWIASLPLANDESGPTQMQFALARHGRAPRARSGKPPASAPAFGSYGVICWSTGLLFVRRTLAVMAGLVPAIHAGPPQEQVPPRRDRQEGGRSQGFSRLPAQMRWAFGDGRDKPGHDALMAPSATSAMLPIPSPQQPTR